LALIACSECQLGPVEGTVDAAPSLGHSDIPPTPTGLTPLHICQNLGDFEIEASKSLSKRAFTYFHSAADSLQALKANYRDWSRISFRPRVMRNVVRAEVNRTIMGQKSSLPIFIAPMAMAKLAHPDGEIGLARAAHQTGIPYAVSTYSSCSPEEIAEFMRLNGSNDRLFFQLYVPRAKNDAIVLIKHARSLGFKALLLTVDTPVVGKREEDDRYKAEVNYQAGVEDSPRVLDSVLDTEPPVLRGFHSSTLNWDDLDWIRAAWADAGPIVLKGIQTAEDALRAYEAGVQGIYLSNHGGRQLDFAPSAVQTLLEIRMFCPQILGKVQIYVDGGVRRGSDILKAICLGATAVGIGRPFMYALGAYGTEGVEKAVHCMYYRPLDKITQLMDVDSVERRA
jgi:L-lactate dehydrogenase (cytochrome)